MTTSITSSLFGPSVPPLGQTPLNLHTGRKGKQTFSKHLVSLLLTLSHSLRFYPPNLRTRDLPWPRFFYYFSLWLGISGARLSSRVVVEAPRTSWSRHLQNMIGRRSCDIQPIIDAITLREAVSRGPIAKHPPAEPNSAIGGGPLCILLPRHHHSFVLSVALPPFMGEHLWLARRQNFGVGLEGQ